MELVDLGDGRALFIGSDAVWITDGTPGGTEAIHPLPSTSSICGQTQVLRQLDRVVFVARHRAFGAEPFVYSKGQVRLLADLFPGTGHGGPDQLTSLSRGLLIATDGPSNFRVRPFYRTRQVFRLAPDGAIDHLLGFPEAPYDRFLLASDRGRGWAWVVGDSGRGLALWRVDTEGLPQPVDLPSAEDLREPKLHGEGEGVWLTAFGRSSGELYVIALPSTGPQRLIRGLLPHSAQTITRVGDDLLIETAGALGSRGLVRVRPRAGEMDDLQQPTTTRIIAVGNEAAVVVRGRRPAGFYRPHDGLQDLRGTEGLQIEDAALDGQGLVLVGRHSDGKGFLGRGRSEGFRLLFESERASSRLRLHAAFGQLFFAAASEDAAGLFVLDGEEVRHVSSLTTFVTQSLNPHQVMPAGARLYFRGQAKERYAVGFSDGTEAGTGMHPKDGYIVGRIDRTIVVGTPGGCSSERFCLEAIAEGDDWRVLSEAQEGLRIASPGVSIGDSLYFYSGLTELWRTDARTLGPVAGTASSMGSAGAPLVALDAGVVFSNAQRGRLRYTDGRSVRDLNVRAGHHFTVGLGDRVVVSGPNVEAVDADGNREVLLEGLDGYRSPSEGSFVVRVGRRVFATQAEGLVVTDGTREGTRTLTLGEPQDRLDAAGAYGMDLVFSARDEAGYELWRSDGTSDGTERWVDLVPGPGDGDPSSFLQVDDYLLFAANTPNLGREIFVSDGTEEGTVLLYDAVAGPAGSDPTWFARVGDRIYFDGLHRAFGREIWSFSWSQALARIEGRTKTSKAPVGGVEGGPRPPLDFQDAPPQCGCRSTPISSGPFGPTVVLVLVGLMAARPRRFSSCLTGCLERLQLRGRGWASGGPRGQGKWW